MLGLYRSLSLRYLGQHWDRAALVAFSIALGVATLVSTRALNQVLDAGVEQTGTPTPWAEVADLFVSNGEIGVRLELADRIRKAKIPDVRSVAPLTIEQVDVPDLGRKAVAVGLDVAALAQSGENRVGVGGKLVEYPADVVAGQAGRVALSALTRKPAAIVVIGPDLAAERRKRQTPVEEPVALRFGKQSLAGYPVGEIVLEGEAAKLGGSLVVLDFREAARLLGRSDQVDRIDLKLEPWADKAAVADAVQRVVGDQATIVTPEAEMAANQAVRRGVQGRPVAVLVRRW